MSRPRVNSRDVRQAQRFTRQAVEPLEDEIVLDADEEAWMEERYGEAADAEFDRALGESRR